MRTSSRVGPPRGAPAFMLVELLVVIGIVGIVLAAVILFFSSSSESAEKVLARESAESDAVQASIRLDGLVSSAGLCRIATYGERHPILAARRDCLFFVTDTDDPGASGPGDTLAILCTDSGILVTDAAGGTIFRSPPSVEASFAYLDWEGEPIDSVDLRDQAGLDRIRRIEWRVVSGYEGGACEIRGGCTPANLMLR